jgi:hypothetical protein
LNPHIETDCKIVLSGHEYESGGSWILKNKKTNLHEGILYRLGEIKRLNQYSNKSIGFIGTWNGKTKVKAYFLNEWISNFGDTRQVVYFMWDGKPFYGIYYKTNSDIIRVKELKKKPDFFLNFDFAPTCSECGYVFDNPYNNCKCEVIDNKNLEAVQE